MIKSTTNHPINQHKWTLAQRIADKIATFAGSWGFILFVILFAVTWAIINAYEIITKFDPYPFVLLNLILALITAVLTPVILMAQNRVSQRDRIRAEYDYLINKKAEKEIEEIKKQLDGIEKKLK